MSSLLENTLQYEEKHMYIPDLFLAISHSIAYQYLEQDDKFWYILKCHCFFILQKEKGKKDKDKGGDIPPVKEADIAQSSKDPNNSSGCVVS